MDSQQKHRAEKQKHAETPSATMKAEIADLTHDLKPRRLPLLQP